MRYLCSLLLIFFALSLFSCNSTPPAQDAEPVPPETESPAPEAGSQPEEDPLPEEPETSTPPDTAQPEEETPELPEPSEPMPLVSLPPDPPSGSEDSYPLDPPQESEIQIPEQVTAPADPVVAEPAAQLLSDSSPPVDASPSVEPSPPVAVSPQVEPPAQPAQEPARSPAAQTPAPQTPPQQAPAPQQTPPPSAPATPPSPPPYLAPAVPEATQPVPAPVSPQQSAALPDLPARTPLESPGEEIVFSRTVRALVGQMIEIPFRGTGWVYLGELGNRRGISYDSRRLDIGSSSGSVDGQSFIFRAEAAGTYILKFYRQDFIQDYIINDHVQVIVGEQPLDSGSGRQGVPVDRGRVIAEPRWPSESGNTAGTSSASATTSESSPPQAAADPLPETASGAADTATAPDPSAAQSMSPAQTTAQSPPAPAASAAPPAVSFNTPAEYVRQAQQEFDAGRVESALVILDTMRQQFPSGSDEAWWLYGQLLEANSSSRDIRLALEFYRRLVREYPQSSRASDAQGRIAWLERYYFNIR